MTLFENEKPTLDELRADIDAIDDDLLRLLNERAKLSLSIGQTAEPGGAPFKPFREQELLERLVTRNPGPLPAPHLRHIYREILSSSRTLQRPQRIVYLGPEGTFSYFAALDHLGHCAQLHPTENFEDIYRAVVDGDADLGVVPLENSVQGSVGQNLDLLCAYDVHIQAELYSRISHGLLSRQSSLTQIKRVYSHPKAFEQCGLWVKSHLSHCAQIPANSTAAAARLVAEEDPEGAAIGNCKLAELFQLRILAEHLEDSADNWTRFLVIGARPTAPVNRNKTSLLFTTLNRPGALAQVLNLMARSGINLVKLESRPAKNERWRYVFFADLECDLGRAEYQKVWQQLEQGCATFKVLGSYPAAAPVSSAARSNNSDAPEPTEAS